MNLRRLELKDAPLMLEWMHDKSVVQDLKTNFLSKTIMDCEKFIISSWDDIQNLNLAIVDDNDAYMGTVGLKNITERTAEFAITIRTVAMGKGYSKYAMGEVLRRGFQEMCLQQIYWCVSPKNKRAIRFYDKNKYQRINVELLKECIRGYSPEEIDSYIWYFKNRN